MNSVNITLLTILASVLASSGFWVFLNKYLDIKSHSTKLLIGLAHDRLVFLGMAYINRGYITKDEYESYYKYLYTPYVALGGNGMVEKIMAEIKQLPLREKEIEVSDEN